MLRNFVFLLFAFIFSTKVFAGAVDSFPKVLRDGVHIGFNAVEPYDACEITIRRTIDEIFVGLKTTSTEESQIIKNDDVFEPAPLYSVQRWVSSPLRHRRIVRAFEGDPDPSGERYGIIVIWGWYPTAPEKNTLVECAYGLPR